MGGSIFKNLWSTLTVIVPGLVTYGTWKLLLLSGNNWRIDETGLAKVDESVFLTACVVAIAILQQALAITLEALICGMCAIKAGRERPGEGYFFADSRSLPKERKP